MQVDLHLTNSHEQLNLYDSFIFIVFRIWGDGGIFYFEHKILFYFFTFRFSKRLFANLETICLVFVGFCAFGFWGVFLKERWRGGRMQVAGSFPIRTIMRVRPCKMHPIEYHNVLEVTGHRKHSAPRIHCNNVPKLLACFFAANQGPLSIPAESHPGFQKSHLDKTLTSQRLSLPSLFDSLKFTLPSNTLESLLKEK